MIHKINIVVSPGSKKSVLKKPLGIFKLYLQAPPVDGKANQELIFKLSKMLKIPQSLISIVSGHSSKSKIVSIQTDCDLELILSKLDSFCE